MIDFSARYQPWLYDPAKARELLKEAGYPNGFTSPCGLPITTAPRRKCCSSFSSNWRR